MIQKYPIFLKICKIYAEKHFKIFKIYVEIYRNMWKISKELNIRIYINHAKNAKEVKIWNKIMCNNMQQYAKVMQKICKKVAENLKNMISGNTQKYARYGGSEV